jgi:hypothetical protein
LVIFPRVDLQVAAVELDPVAHMRNPENRTTGD